jgi:hypothetical protein
MKEIKAALLKDAYCELALDAVASSPVGVDKALANWERAIAAAKVYKGHEETVSEVRENILARVRSLSETTGDTRLDAINDAVRLTQEGSEKGWDSADGLLRNALVDALGSRAAHLANKFDMYHEARRDCLNAYSLMPDSLSVIYELSWISLYYAKALFARGDRDLARALTKEVEDRLEEGEKRFPGNGDLRQVRQWTTEFQEALERKSADVDGILTALSARIQAMPGEGYHSRLALAINAEAQSNYEDATTQYWQLMLDYPAQSQELRGKLCYCYRRWLYAVQESEDQLRTVLSLARDRCPESKVLTDWFDWARED